MWDALLKWAVAWGAKGLGMKLVHDAQYKADLDASYAAGKAKGIAEESARREQDALTQPKPVTAKEAAGRLNAAYSAPDPLAGLRRP